MVVMAFMLLIYGLYPESPIIFTFCSDLEVQTMHSSCDVNLDIFYKHQLATSSEFVLFYLLIKPCIFSGDSDFPNMCHSQRTSNTRTVADDPGEQSPSKHHISGWCERIKALPGQAWLQRG